MKKIVSIALAISIPAILSAQLQCKDRYKGSADYQKKIQVNTKWNQYRNNHLNQSIQQAANGFANSVCSYYINPYLHGVQAWQYKIPHCGFQRPSSPAPSLATTSKPAYIVISACKLQPMKIDKKAKEAMKHMKIKPKTVTATPINYKH